MITNRCRTVLVLLTLASLLLPLAVISAQGPAVDVTSLIRTDDVMGHVRALSVAIGARPAGSSAEASAAAYVEAALIDYGYTVEVQSFDTLWWPDETVTDGTPITSQNVIGTRPGDEQIIVIGAHLDSTGGGTGASDNGSGVAVMLAAAEALAGIETTHTLMFVGFGAEEVGDPTGQDPTNRSGAGVLVETLGADMDNVIAMINIDTVGMGTTPNVYAGAVIEWSQDGVPTITGGPVEVRDLALAQAEALGLSFGTTPDESWGGYTGDWSDHYVFVRAGVPVAYFEAWNWSADYDPWWGQETPEGDLMHTAGDVYENVVPEKVEQVAEVVAATIVALAG